jgi:hypothetical protein
VGFYFWLCKCIVVVGGFNTGWYFLIGVNDMVCGSDLIFDVIWKMKKKYDFERRFKEGGV